jgi:hypothetical protein
LGALAGGLGCCPFDDGHSHPPSHSRYRLLAFGVCRPLVGGEAPAGQQCSTSSSLRAGAAPQCISGRTSYLRVRLAFHPYPQVIRAVCNRHRCGPPRPIRDASACPWVAHTVSGLPCATEDALLRLAFAMAPAVTALTGPRRVTRRVILQKARRHLNKEASTAWKQTISGSISLPSPGCFSPFPHGTVRYRSTSVCSLGRWSPQLPTRFFVPGGTQEQDAGAKRDTRPGYHGLRRRVPNAFGCARSAPVRYSSIACPVLQPRFRNGCCLDTETV